MLDLLGPRWRRDARLLHHPGESHGVDETEPPLPVTAQPYTPPPPDLPPGPLAPAAAETPPPDVPPARGGAGRAAAPPRRARLPLLAAAVAARGLAAVAVSPLAAGGTERLGAATRVVRDPGRQPDDERVVRVGLGAAGRPSRARRPPSPPTTRPTATSVARVTSAVDGDQYAIDDEPDVVLDGSVEGRPLHGERVGEGDGVRRPQAGLHRDPRVVAGPPRRVVHGDRGGQRDGDAPRSTSRSPRVRYVAAADGNTIDVHVYRWSDDVTSGEAFLVDDITVTERPSSGENTQLVDDATCGA